MVEAITNTASTRRASREAETPLRLSARETAPPEAAAPPVDVGELFTHADRTIGAGAEARAASAFLEDLNTFRTQELNTVYDAGGAARRVSSNTILIGYG